MAEARLDAELVARGLCSGRERARAEIEAGHVTVNGRPASKPSQKVAESDVIELSGAFDYVSRGAKKLLGALEAFHISPEGLVCLDCGASTGGFTEVLLRHGARKVYAVDVGHGQLAEKLQRDPRVVNMEGTNVRSLALSSFDPAPELITADLSFISLALVLPVLHGLLGESGRVVCLVKPQCCTVSFPMRRRAASPSSGWRCRLCAGRRAILNFSRISAPPEAVRRSI